VLIAAIRSIATYVAVSLYVLIVGPPGMLVAILFGAKEHLYVLGHAGVRLGMFLSGIRFRLAGREHVPTDRPPCIAPTIRATSIRRCCSRRASAAAHPVQGGDRRHPGARPRVSARRVHSGRSPQQGSGAAIDRSRRHVDSLRQLVPDLSRGTRSRTADLLPFKKGGFIMAIKAQAPIVPVAVQGGTAAMREGSKFIRPVTVSIRIGEPIETAG
jgi:1-acyl-sn-glycerol-3-phosphate acyltransferase